MDSITGNAAKHLKDVYFGGNWTAVNVFGVIQDISFAEIHQKINGFHSILELVYHQYYFVTSLKMVLKGEELTTKDKFSFDHPPVNNEIEWSSFQTMIGETVLETVHLLEQMPDEQLLQPFVRPEYGTWFRNISGVIEHIHYHLGQLTILKKLIRQEL